MISIQEGSIDADAPSIPEIVLRTDMTNFGNDNVTVTLEWSQHSGETYTVVTVPEAVNVSFITSTSVQLVLLYNTEYNVTVTATLCGHSNATNFTTIHYGIIVHTGNATNAMVAYIIIRVCMIFPLIALSYCLQ